MINSKNLIDCLILMANSLPLLKRMHEENVEALMPKVLLPPGPDWENTRDKILAMEG